MPTLKLTNLATYKAYFAAIAVSHVAIDGFKWGDKDVMHNDNRSDMSARVLWAQPYEQARYNDSYSDNITKTKEARVAYMVIAESELFADEDEALEDCEAVIEQIIAKMIKDKSGVEVVAEDLSVTWHLLAMNVSGITTRPVEAIFGSTKYIGWEMTIPFIDNTNFVYDSEQWI